MSANRTNFSRSSKKGKKKPTTKLLCRYCHAVYDGKGWIPFAKMNPAIIDQLHASVCPACHEIKDHVSDGVLHIAGTGLKPLLQEIKNHIARMGREAEAKNILDRVERVDVEGAGLVVYTTLNQLTVKIGKALSSANKGGDLKIKWSKTDKPAECWWTYNK